MNALVAIALFALAIGLIALVGHSLWVVLAAIFGTSREPRPPRRRLCPGCQADVLPSDPSCMKCGLELGSRLADRLERIRFAQREVRGLAQREELDREEAERVATLLGRRARRLLEGDEPLPQAVPVARIAEVAVELPSSEPAAGEVATPPLLSSFPSAEPSPSPPLADTPPPPDGAEFPERHRHGMLAAFMEERNILWGEIAGGLLIVGCSIALVLTLWRTLEQLPYFPFLLSSAVTFGLFGAGQYTLHHWRLASTSRGLLVISLLLAPLNLLLLANPGTDAGGGSIDIAVKVTAVVLFVGMVRRIGRDLIGTDLLPGPVDRRWLLALAVVGAPASQSLPFATGTLAAWLPLLCHAIACGAVLGGLSWYRPRDDREPFDGRRVFAILTFVGISLFALFAAWGLVLSRAPDVGDTLRLLSLALAIAGVPVVEAGLLVQRRAIGQAGLRAAGTGTALAGSLLLAAGITLAWPDPLWLMLAAALVGAVFTRVAWKESQPWYQVGALPAFALAAVLAVHWLAGNLPVPEDTPRVLWLRHLFGTTTTGLAFAGLALTFGAIGEMVARFGNRLQAVGYALGGVALGIAALFLVTVGGIEEPWPAVIVHFACAAGLVASNFRWRKRAVAEVAVWLVFIGTLWTLQAVAAEDRTIWGLTVAIESLVLAAAALALMRSAARPGAVGVVSGQLRLAAANVAAAAGAVAVAFTLTAGDFPQGKLHGASLLALVPVGLMLTRVFALPWPTWAASAALLAGLLHTAIYSLEIRPYAAAILPALLTHASLGLGLAFAFRGRRSRKWLFGNPLRLSARATSCLTVPFLFAVPAGLALEWAGAALWLAIVWFALSWLWREAGAFSASQAALAAAAVLCGLAWAERQEWWTTTPLGFGDPRLLQAAGTGLGLLALGWTGARRLASRNERLRKLWLSDPFASDRVILGIVVVVQIVLLGIAVEPAVLMEQTPLLLEFDWVPAAEWWAAFGPGTWLVIGLLGLALAAGLRLRTEDEPESDGHVVGLMLLFLSMPLAASGSFVSGIAAASALRWGLAAAFVLGSAMLFARGDLARLASTAGCRLKTTSISVTGSYAALALAAIVVLLLTGNLVSLGLRGLRPSGPVEGTMFAKVGWTASFVIPLSLLVVGLVLSAIREKLPAYAFAGGLVFTGAVTAGYALVIVTGGDRIDEIVRSRLAMLAFASIAAWATAWLLAERKVPGGVFLPVQVLLGIGGMGLIGVALIGWTFFQADAAMPEALTEYGRFGWVVLALTSWAAFELATRRLPESRSHVVGFGLVVAGGLAAAAAQMWESPGWHAPFYTMIAVWAAAGLALVGARFLVPTASHEAWIAAIAFGLAMAALRSLAIQDELWPTPLALASYAFAGSALAVTLARRQSGEIRLLEEDRWQLFTFSQGIIAAVGLALAVLSAVTSDHLIERLAGPLAVALLALAAGLLAIATRAKLSYGLRCAATATAGLCFALIGWAVPDPETRAVWLVRNGWAFVALVVAALGALELPPRLRADSPWASAVRRIGGFLAVAAIAWLAIVLLQQVPVFDLLTRRTPLGLPEVLAILAGIGISITMAIRCALLTAADPLELPESNRTRYVYLAEVLLVLGFVHVRLNLPELFLPQAVRYWTFLVMLLAFVGIGLAEFFERRGTNVLAVPLRRTGVLLPLIPLLAFWLKPPGFLIGWADVRAPGVRPFLGYLEKLPQYFDNYAGLWFLAGLLYGLVALSRRLFGWALLAALAANAGVWSLLAHTGVSATVHPQVWAIPLALIVLVAEHVHRRELRPEVSSGLRYLGIGMLYVSSAADMFIAGVGQSVWLPVILAIFCVGGIFAGILLRVRAFLFLGAGFLLLDVFAMIWHAAVDREQTWVWYASGIVLGVAIIALFALFEKRRNDVLGVVERIKGWD